jgi:nucleotide-binding universal stress UspA family protein
MPGYRRILVALDFSESNAHTLEVAVDLAVAFQAQLHLGHIVPLNGAGEPEAQAAMAAFAVPGPPGLVASRSVFKALSPDLGLLQLAREREIDLIAIGTHGRSGLAHIRLGSTAERVVQHSACPVLTVRDLPRAPLKEDCP